MKRFLAVACAAVIGLAVASQARAQSASGVHFGVAAGAGAPAGDTSDTFETGFSGSAFLNWTPSVSPVGLRVEGMYHNMGVESEADPDTGDAEIVAGLAGAVIAPKNGTVKPYAVAGGGAYNVDVDRSGLVNTDGLNSTEFGWNAGGGLAFPVGKTNVFVEARDHFEANANRDGLVEYDQDLSLRPALADMADAEREDEAVQRNLAARIDGLEQVFDRLDTETLLVRELLRGVAIALFEREDVRRRGRVVQLIGRRVPGAGHLVVAEAVGGRAWVFQGATHEDRRVRIRDLARLGRGSALGADLD